MGIYFLISLMTLVYGVARFLVRANLGEAISSGVLLIFFLYLIIKNLKISNFEILLKFGWFSKVMLLPVIISFGFGVMEYLNGDRIALVLLNMIFSVIFFIAFLSIFNKNYLNK